VNWPQKSIATKFERPAAEKPQQNRMKYTISEDHTEHISTRQKAQFVALRHARCPRPVLGKAISAHGMKFVAVPPPKVTNEYIFTID
jgi:hypothetical protein